MQPTLEIPHNNVIPMSMDIPVYGELAKLIGVNSVHTDVINSDIPGCLIQWCVIHAKTRDFPGMLYLKKTGDNIKCILILSKAGSPENKYAGDYVFYDKELTESY